MAHPLHLLTADEIRSASSILLQHVQQESKAAEQDLNIHFKNISLHDPPKALLLPYLDAEANGTPVHQRPYVPRCVDIIWSTGNGRRVTESTVSLDANKIVTETHAAKGQHGPNDRIEIRGASQTLLNDSRVLDAIKKLKLPDGVIVACDPWMYGADRESNEDTPKYIQGLLYARAPNNHPDSNQYAYPLPFSPRLDLFSGEVVSIDPIATGGEQDGLAYHTAPDEPMAHLQPNEYYPDLLESPRTDLKPLHVHQPDGPSFMVSENRVHWQKWSFMVGFNYREGATIHDVRFDGRPLFYRLSVSEMTVPYGVLCIANRLSISETQGLAAVQTTCNWAVTVLVPSSTSQAGSATIKYFSGWLSDDQGNPVPAENVICMHEQDGGVGWKHTNPRTDNPSLTRARNLIVQTIITVGNYEYIFAWIFWQNGNVELETRATGILSTQLIDAGKTSPWGTVVSPGVLAANHQHLFSFRIDPMIDGQFNSVIQEDSVAVPQSEEENPHGNAWRVEKTPFERSGFADAAPFANRHFKIANESRLNPISQNPVGYKVFPQPTQLLLAGPKSVVRRRARFAEHHVWVTKYRDGDLWAGGKWTNQSLAETDGVADYAARNEAVRNEDLVLWLTYGTTHNPTVEQFPVMPVDVMTISLKPADFFTRNPAMDVPQSTQKANKSVLVLNPLPSVDRAVEGGNAQTEATKPRL